jgi:polyhydroxybutyrate depolymerase
MNLMQKSWLPPLGLCLLTSLLSAQTSRARSGEHHIRQSWSQKKSFDRPYQVSVPAHANAEKLPTLVFLHGNGGNARSALQHFRKRYRQLAATHILVFPQGYRASWNIVAEASKANDKRFIEAIIQRLSTFKNVDKRRFSIMGNSNGAALVNQLAIESRLPAITNLITCASPLNACQHDGKNFKAKGSDNGYSKRAKPIKGRRLMNISGVVDKLIPYRGGPSRSIPAKIGKLEFVDAELSTYYWAKHMGFKGKQPHKPNSTDGNLEVFRYLNGDVIHYKVNNVGHGAMSAITETMLLDFLMGQESPERPNRRHP